MAVAPAPVPPTRGPAPVAAVTIQDPFWAQEQAKVRAALDAQWQQLVARGTLEALTLTWQPGESYTPHIFWESDLAKWLEAASYALAAPTAPLDDEIAAAAAFDDDTEEDDTEEDDTDDDAARTRLADRVAEAVAALAGAQQPDGYLNAYFTTVEPGRRFTDHQDAHELYCAGHLIEAAVAHHEATGLDTLLDVARGYADLIEREFGPGGSCEGGYDGHPEIELALVRLFRATAERRYLDLAARLVEARGRQPWFFVEEARRRGDAGHFAGFALGRAEHPERWAPYQQSHLPVREQREAVGHAVRAMYLYTGALDVALESGDAGLREAVDALWRDVTERKMYVTGAIGTEPATEGFGAPFHLPAATGYGETCAAIGLANWASRLADASGEARYAEVVETCLYNGVLSGKSASGDRYFYANHLSSDGSDHRSAWFETSCCPTNVARFVLSLGRLLYSVGTIEGATGSTAHSASDGPADGRSGSPASSRSGSPASSRSGSTAPGRREVTVNHLVASTLRTSARTAEGVDVDVEVAVRTEHPRVPAAVVEVSTDAPVRLALRVRVPAGAREVRLDGEPAAAVVVDGHVVLDRIWSGRESVWLTYELPVERVHAHPAVIDARGKVAVRRGPVVYCVEEADTGFPTSQLVLPDGPVRLLPDSLSGQVELEVLGRRVEPAAGALYASAPPVERPVTTRLVPSFFWDNRAPGSMDVWIREA